MKLYTDKVVLFIVSPLAVFLTILLALHLSKVDEKDYTFWKKLIQSSKTNQDEIKDRVCIEHISQNVSKELYLRKENPLYLHLTSPLSRFKLHFLQKEVQAEETFEELTALIQEKRYYVNEEGKECTEGKPMQCIRLIKAKKGHFNYTQQKLTAEESLSLYSYHVSGHCPPLQIESSPFMTAFAEKAVLDCNDREPHLMCHKLNLTLSIENNKPIRVAADCAYLEKEKVSLEGAITINLSNDSLMTCDKALLSLSSMHSTFEGSVHFTNSLHNLNITSTKAEIDFEKKEETLKAHKVVLVDNVQLIQKAMRSITAAKVTYFPEEDQMIFEGTPVYFYDATQKIAIAAKKIECFSLSSPHNEKITTTDDVHVVIQNDIIEKLRRQIPL